MTVQELIEKLSAFEGSIEVGIVFDGCERMEVEQVWVARSGRVLICSSGQAVYDTEDRPADAPTTEQDSYWETPK